MNVKFNTRLVEGRSYLKVDVTPKAVVLRIGINADEVQRRIDGVLDRVGLRTDDEASR